MAACVNGQQSDSSDVGAIPVLRGWPRKRARGDNARGQRGRNTTTNANRAAELIESGVLGLKCGWVWVSV